MPSTTNAPVFGDPGIALNHRALQLDRAADGTDDAWEFHQQPVASCLDEAAAMLLELWFDELAAKDFEAVEGTLLIRSHQARVACHIGGEDCRETASGGRSGHCSDGDNSRAEFNLLRATKRQFRPDLTLGRDSAAGAGDLPLS